MNSCGGLCRLAGLEILELHPNLTVLANLHLQIIQSARRRAGRGTNLAAQSEGAVVARAMVTLSGWIIIDEAARMRTNHIQRLDRFLAGAPEVNGAYGRLGRFIPGVGAAGDDGEFSR